MSIELSSIEVGTVLINNTQFGSSWVKVESLRVTRWGTELVGSVVVADFEVTGEKKYIGHVGDVSMRGIGFKLQTPQEEQRLVRRLAWEAKQVESESAQA